MKKSTNPLMHLLVLLALSLVMLLITTPLSVLLASPSSLVGVYAAQVVMQLCCLLLPTLVVVHRYYRSDRVGFMRLNVNSRSWLRAAAGVVILALLVPVVDSLELLNRQFEFPASMAALEQSLRDTQAATQALSDRMLGGGDVGRLLLNLLVMALLPAVCEEFFFRVGIQNLIQRWCRSHGMGRGRICWDAHLAVWVTAVIFSLAHGEVFSFLPRLVLGAMLGYLFVYSNSLLVNTMVHFLNNAFIVVGQWLVSCGVWSYDFDNPTGYPWLTCVTFALAAVVVLDLLFIHPPQRWRDADADLADRCDG